VTTIRQTIHHLSVKRNGQVAVATDFYPYSSQDLHDVASVTKSITSLLIGIAIDKEFIKDEFQKVMPLFPERDTAMDTASAISLKKKNPFR